LLHLVPNRRVEFFNGMRIIDDSGHGSGPGSEQEKASYHRNFGRAAKATQSRPQSPVVIPTLPPVTVLRFSAMELSSRPACWAYPFEAVDSPQPIR
jgi:hypothetical protein